jgi:hypothetical protein
MNERKSPFASPTVLTDDTIILGATAKEWHQALTGGFQKSLDIVKARAQALPSDTPRQQLDTSSAQMDLASSYKKNRE